MKWRKTLFIIHMKVLGALDRPNDITNHLYNPSKVLKIVFHSFPGRIRILW